MKTKSNLDWIQWAAVVISIAGVICNNSQCRWCFPLWIVSNTICLAFHARSKLWGLAVRDVVFTVLSVAGWIQWSI